MAIVYECDCHDFEKEGRNGCMHTIAEEVVRGILVVVGEISEKRARAAQAKRRPTRKRISESGKSVRTTQSDARKSFGRELPRLVVSLVKAWEKKQREGDQVAGRVGNVVILKHRPPTDAVIRAATLLYKFAMNKSADKMDVEYGRLIEEGCLRLAQPPHRNSLTHWINDATLTPILEEWLRMTAFAFQRREIGAIIDSSKVSQMSTAHYRRVQYEGDERPGADWMRCHAIVGVETLVCMAVQFGPNRGVGETGDSLFLQPLMVEALKLFRLHYLLADKAYFKRENIEWLWEQGVRAVISAKKNTIREKDARGKRRDAEIFHPYWDLIKWFDERQADFREIYRLRPKIEGFFSLLKREAEEHMWSRGRAHKHPDGTRTFEPMNDGPCTAWKNEALCKFIFMNLRATNTLQEETGVEIDYLVPGRCFPEPLEPLLRAA
jgi:hypothetical protein